MKKFLVTSILFMFIIGGIVQGRTIVCKKISDAQRSVTASKVLVEEAINDYDSGLDINSINGTNFFTSFILPVAYNTILTNAQSTIDGTSVLSVSTNSEAVARDSGLYITNYNEIVNNSDLTSLQLDAFIDVVNRLVDTTAEYATAYQNLDFSRSATCILANQSGKRSSITPETLKKDIPVNELKKQEIEVQDTTLDNNNISMSPFKQKKVDYIVTKLLHYIEKSEDINVAKNEIRKILHDKRETFIVDNSFEEVLIVDYVLEKFE